MTAIDPALTYRAVLVLESFFGAGLLSTPVQEALGPQGLGLTADEITIATRVAPMGAVSGPVATAAFFNFNPTYIEGAIPSAWAKASPERILEVQVESLAPALGAAMAEIPTADLDELAALTRAAAMSVSNRTEGRPLFAGLTSSPWPDGSAMVIWHASRLLREFRGDGHIAALVAAGLRAVDVVVVHAGFDANLSEALRHTRQWGETAWDDSMARLRADGWLTDEARPTLTEEGRRRRLEIERRTDELAVPAYEVLGADGFERRRELARPAGRAIRAAGLVDQLAAMLGSPGGATPAR